MILLELSIEYDPNRNANISLIQYEDGENVIFYIQKH
jgi:ribosomal protein L2